MPVSCHFRGCKAPLSRIVSGAISSELALPLLSATPYRMRMGPKRNTVLRFPSVNTHTLLRRTTKFNMVTHIGWGLFLDGQPRPNPKRAWSQRSEILGFLSIYAYTPFVAELPNLTWGKWEKGVYRVVSHASHPKRAPQFLEFSCIYAYMYIM